MLIVFLMTNSADAQYSSQFLKNRQQQRQIARAIEVAKARERTRDAIKKVGRPIVTRRKR
jgi:hypothetical protein